MVLADTNIWIEHFRSEIKEFKDLLFDNKVLIHPFIIGELACGYIEDRKNIFKYLHDLPTAKQATDEEVISMIDNLQLNGLGLGYIDMHLLASAKLTNCKLLTYDKKLDEVYKKHFI